MFFTIREPNDSFGFSTDLVSDRKIFQYNFEHFSDSKCFSNYCTVNYDQSMKIYNWNYPDWFKCKEYNSITEFIIAYLEQMLCVRYWYYKEECKEKQMKTLHQNSFTVTDDLIFNDLFDTRNKLITYLKEEYADKSLFRKLDIKSIINEVKNDPSISNKLIKPPSDNRNYYYLYKQKHEIQDPSSLENETEIVKKFTDSYYRSEEKLVDELLFVSIEKLSTLEDFTAKGIYNALTNLYAEKNANDLMLNLENEKVKQKGKKRKTKAIVTKKKETAKGQAANSDHSTEEKQTNKKSNLVTEKFRTKRTISNSLLGDADSFENDDGSSAANQLIKEHHKDTVLLKVNYDIPAEKLNAQGLPFRCNENSLYVESLVNNIMNNVILTYNPILDDKLYSLDTESKTLKDNKTERKNEIRRNENKSSNENTEIKKNNKIEDIITTEQEEAPISSTFQPPESKIETENETHTTSKPNKKAGKKNEPKSFFLYPSTTTGKKQKNKSEKPTNTVHPSKSLTPKVSVSVSTGCDTTVSVQASIIDYTKLEKDNQDKSNDSNKVVTSNNSEFSKRMIDSSSQTEVKNIENVIENSASFEQQNEKKRNEMSITNNAADVELNPPLNEKNRVADSKITTTNDSFKLPSKIDYSLPMQQPTFINSKKQSQEERFFLEKSHSYKEDLIATKEMSSSSTNTELANQSEEANLFSSEKAPRKKTNPQNAQNSKQISNGQNKYNINSQNSFTVNRANEPSNSFSRFDNYTSNNPLFSQTQVSMSKALSFANPTKSSGLNINKTSSFEISRPQQNYYIYNSNISFNNPISLLPNSNDVNQTSGGGYSPINPNSQTSWSRKAQGEVNILKKLNFEEFSPCTFSHKLHNDILEYSSNVKTILENVKPIKEVMIRIIKEMLNLSIDQDFTSELYGSYATDLSIESSDIDILIKLNSEGFDPEALISKICIFLASFKMFDNINPIASAAIPVIKLVS